MSEHEHHHHDGFAWGRLQAWIQTGIMYLMSLYLVDLALPGGKLGNYINTSNFGWLTWVAAGLFLVLAIANTIELLRGDDHSHDHDYEHSHPNAGSLRSWFFLMVVALPLILGVGVPSKPLAADAIADGELSTDIAAVGFSDQPTGDIAPENRNILDWVRVLQSSSDLNGFTEQPVDVIGFVYRDTRFIGSDDFMVVRFTLSCCVADARAIGLVVINQNEPELAQDTWVQVTGHIEVREIDGVETPVIIAESITVTDEPEQPYLYF
jgi:uncharacterized repeat protein (TIGR03943 family)